MPAPLYLALWIVAVVALVVSYNLAINSEDLDE